MAAVVHDGDVDRPAHDDEVAQTAAAVPAVRALDSIDRVRDGQRVGSSTERQESGREDDRRERERANQGGLDPFPIWPQWLNRTATHQPLFSLVLSYFRSLTPCKRSCQTRSARSGQRRGAGAPRA